MTAAVAPGSRPCGSCPYRRDVPSGVWAAAEYAKLIAYDRETWAQPTGMFACHQQDGCLCAGWVAVHDMQDSLAVRLALAGGRLSVAEAVALDEYRADVPVFGSGREAAEHGLRDLKAPGARATRTIEKLDRRQAAR